MEIIVNYESDSEDEETVKSKSRKAFSAEFKLKMVKHAKDVSVHSASSTFKVDRKNIREWVNQESKLHQIKNSSPGGEMKKRLPGGGRPITFKDLDMELAVWVREKRSKKLRVSREIIMRQAEKSFNSEKDGGNFKASRGWLERFLARHNFRLRMPTTVCQKTPSDYIQKIVDFLLYVSEVRKRNNYQGIYAADETAVYLDPSRGRCIDECGAKEVSVLTTGHDKARITVMLTARFDGKKMKPFVLMDRKKGKDVTAPSEKFESKLELC